MGGNNNSPPTSGAHVGGSSTTDSRMTKGSSMTTKIRYDIANKRMGEIWRYQQLLRDLLMLVRDLTRYTNDLVSVLISKDERVRKHATDVFKNLEKKVHLVQNEMGGAFGHTRYHLQDGRF
jgi:hypothetical protein